MLKDLVLNISTNQIQQCLKAVQTQIRHKKNFLLFFITGKRLNVKFTKFRLLDYKKKGKINRLTVIRTTNDKITTSP